MTGHSGGGTAALAIALMDRIKHIPAAIATSAAGFTKADLAEFKCRTPLPVMVMHSSEDTLFPGFGAEAAVSSRTVVADHPLQLGERVTEEFSLAGRHARIDWTVRESRPPRRWVLSGKTEDGGTATMTYMLTPERQGTRLSRHFLYNVPVLLDELGGFLSLRNRLQAECAESMRRLKRILETGNTGGAH
ncbi:MAG: SRPBCC family protein [Gammaproteobacteria bacterium]